MKRKCTGVLFASIGFLGLCGGGNAFAQLEGEYQIQPIFTRYAETAKKVTFNASARIFNHVQLQEADHFDGWGVDADITIPVPYTERFQLRVFWPFYTEGDAQHIDPSKQRIDIHGYGGTLDFANVQLEYQFLKEADHGFNGAFYAGIGERQRVLWTTTVDRDIYNHAGQFGLLGFKADWRHSDEWRFVANVGGRYYWKSDDLNPGGGSDEFGLADISLAAIYHPWSAPVYPVGELVYQGDFSQYNSVLLVPEVVFAVCKHLELKAGATLGLTGDGENIGGRFQATVRF